MFANIFSVCDLSSNFAMAFALSHWLKKICSQIYCPFLWPWAHGFKNLNGVSRVVDEGNDAKQIYKDFIHVFHKTCHEIFVDKVEKWELDDEIHQSAFIVYSMNIHEECWLMDSCQLDSLVLDEDRRHKSHFFQKKRMLKMRYLIPWITKSRLKKILTGKNSEFKSNKTN